MVRSQGKVGVEVRTGSGGVVKSEGRVGGSSGTRERGKTRRVVVRSEGKVGFRVRAGSGIADRAGFAGKSEVRVREGRKRRDSRVEARHQERVGVRGSGEVRVREEKEGVESRVGGQGGVGIRVERRVRGEGQGRVGLSGEGKTRG